MYHFFKRIFDLLSALIVIIVFSPLLILLSVWIAFDSKGGVFYKQERVGKNGKLFPCYKFRTMIPNAESIKKDLLDKSDRGDVFFKMCGL